MAQLKKIIGLRDIRALSPGEKIWDSKVVGFHARRQSGDVVTYVLTYRSAEGRRRWLTIGRHGAGWTPDSARTRAQEVLGDVVKGADPASRRQESRTAPTVAGLCDQYLEAAEAGRLLTRHKHPEKASTLQTDRGRIERHIKPLLGQLRLAAVAREDIVSFMHAVAEGKTAARVKTKSRGLARVTGGRGGASRTVGLLGAIFSFAVRERLRVDNPVRGVARFADGRRERRLGEDEYAALGKALRDSEEAREWLPAVKAARFLALTGWRRGEVLGLRWSEIDIQRRTARLGDTKTGVSVRPLSNAACEILRAIGPSDRLVFAATRGDRPMAGFPKMWARIAARSSLPTDITPHVLRHSYASLASDLDYSELTIAALLGHKGRSMTSRYVHSADAVLLAAADAVARRTCELMGELNSGNVITASFTRT